MQPYQEASEAVREHGEFPIRVAKKLGSAALSGLGFAGGKEIASRVLPLLSKYVPPDLATKGLSKIDPRFGDFINKSLNSGESFDKVREFLGEKFGEADLPPPAPQKEKNIIEKYSPELHQFILGEIQKGRSPLEAGALANLDLSKGKGFKKIISKIEKDHKTSWSTILQSIYGSSEQAQPQKNDEQIDPQLMQLLEQGNALLKQGRGNRG